MPLPTNGAESAPGHPRVSAEVKPAPNVEPQAAPGAQLIDKLFELARDWNLDGAAARVERALELRLSRDDSRMAGTSSRWPMTVAYHPPRADRRGALHVSFTNVTSVDLAEMTRRFGAPVTQFESKAAHVEFESPAGVRITAGLLGGLAQDSPVAWIRLEGPGPRPPPPKDLF